MGRFLRAELRGRCSGRSSIPKLRAGDRHRGTWERVAPKGALTGDLATAPPLLLPNKSRVPRFAEGWLPPTTATIPETPTACELTRALGWVLKTCTLGAEGTAWWQHACSAWGGPGFDRQHQKQSGRFGSSHWLWYHTLLWKMWEYLANWRILWDMKENQWFSNLVIAFLLLLCFRLKENEESLGALAKLTKWKIPTTRGSSVCPRMWQPGHPGTPSHCWGRLMRVSSAFLRGW